MKLRKKHLVVMLVALIAIVGLMAAPTYSYLTSKSAEVVNTFQGGIIEISLDEAVVDTYGQPVTDRDTGEATGERTQEGVGNTYRYLAGATLTKDPAVTVFAGSDACYVYICVVDQLTSSGLFTTDYDADAGEWVAVSADTDADSGTTTTVYRYKEVVDASESETDITLSAIFTTITVSEDLTADDIAALGTRTITVTSCAVQSANITQDAADALAIRELTGAEADA